MGARTDDRIGELLLRARTDSAAFGEVYERTEALVLRYLLHRTACPYTSADLCAESYAQALLSLRRYDPGKGDGTGWLVGIARNQLRQYLRRERVSTDARRRLGVPCDLDDRIDLERVEALVDLERLRRELADGVGQLTPAVRDAVLLRVVEGLPYAEVADVLGCSAGSARVRVSRGLDRLSQLLGGMA